MQLVIFVLEVSPAPSAVVSTCCFTGLVRVGLKIPLNENRAHVYGHPSMVRGNVWLTLCSVFVTCARVAQPVSCNS